MQVRVAVIGAGYWGPNLIRNFTASPRTRVVAVCDRDPARLQRVQALNPAAATTTDLEAVLGRTDIDAIAIATPVHTHAGLGLAALRAGKHVLVEKPLAASVAQAEELVEEARQRGLVLMVDHTFLYSPAVRKLKGLIDADELGEIYYVDSVRINLGLFQHDVNVLWDLAPHDLSIVDHLLGRAPASVTAFGACHADIHKQTEDIAYMSLDYDGGLLASFHVNWLSPVKIRQFIVGGSKKSVVYNDLEPTEKIKVYDRGIITHNTDVEARHGIMVSYRVGDVWSPHIEQVEPLQTMVSHFAECVTRRERPISDGAFGLRIVRILEAAQSSIKGRGQRVNLLRPLRVVA
jgi:predicted dehydrogenase